MLRYRQLHEGYPVIGGELVLSLDALGQMNSLSGEISRDLKLRSLQPVVAAARARETALAAMATIRNWPRTCWPAHRAVGVRPASSSVRKSVTRLVWRMDVTTRGATSPLRELVLVNAGDGAIPLHFNQVEAGLDQATYTANKVPRPCRERFCAMKRS